MDRRQFILSSCATLFAGLVAQSSGGEALAAPRQGGEGDTKDGDDVTPLPEITAAVDVLVPADPEIPGDFKGSDYGGDRVVARSLGDLGQTLAKGYLDQHARKAAGKSFLACDEVQRLEAIKGWVREMDAQEPLVKDLLTGLLTLSIIGTYEDNSEAEQREVFEAMGWFDPNDPGGTFRVPNEGYPDAHQFPAGIRMTGAKGTEGGRR